MSSGPVQRQRHGGVGGGRDGLGEGGVREAGRVGVPRRLSSHLWFCFFCDPGASVPMGAGSARGQHRGLPALLLLFLEPSQEPADCSLVPTLQLGELFKSVQDDQVPREERSVDKKSENSHVPNFPLTEEIMTELTKPL